VPPVLLYGVSSKSREMNLGCRRNSRPYVDAGVQKLGAEDSGGWYNFVIRNFIIFSIILFSDYVGRI